MIIGLKEDWTGLVAESQAEATRQAQSCTRVFNVRFDDGDVPATRPLIARDHSVFIPQMWESHPYSTWLYVNNKTVEPDGGPFDFKVRVNYVSDPEPLAQEPVLSWLFATSNEPIDRDINGHPLVNSAGQSFDPPITRDCDDLILRIERNQESFNYGQAGIFKGAVNNDTFWGFSPGSVKCNVYEGTLDRVAWMTFWRVSYEFQIRSDGWRRRILDEGMYTFGGVDAQGYPLWEPILDSKDNPVTQPFPLDGSGNKLSGDRYTSLNHEFLEFDLYPRYNFSVLGLE